MKPTFSEIHSDKSKTLKYKEAERDPKGFLRNWGVSADFLNISKVIIMRPLSVSGITRVTRKTLAPLIKSYQKKGYKIILQKNFLDKFIKIFYSHEEGLYGFQFLIPKFLEFSISQIRSQALKKGKLPEQIEIHLRLKGDLPAEGYSKLPASIKAPWESVESLKASKNSSKKFTFFLPRSLKNSKKAAASNPASPRKMTLEGEARINGQNIEFSEDLTPLVNLKIIPEKIWKRKIRSAYHEAGHAVALIGPPLKTTIPNTSKS